MGIVTSALIAIYHFNDLQNAHLVEGAISPGAVRGGLNILAAIAFVSFEYEKKAGAAFDSASDSALYHVDLFHSAITAKVVYFGSAGFVFHAVSNIRFRHSAVLGRGIL